MLSQTRRSLASTHRWLWLIAGLALVLRLLLVSHGLPYELDADERLFVESAWRMVESGSGDPAWYSHPAATLMDAMALLYAGYTAIGGLLGWSDAVAEAGAAYRSDVSHFFILGRLLVVVSGVAVVLLTYAVTRSLRIRPDWALVAALLMAVSPAMVQYSALVRTDMAMVAFVLGALLLSIRVVAFPSVRAFALAGVCLGLSAASKYTGGLAIVPIVAANATLVVRERITPRRGLGWLAVAVAGGALAAFAVGPYLFVNAPDAVRDFATEASSRHFGATGAGLVRGMWRYLVEALPWGLGGITTVVGLIGLLVMLRWRRPRIGSISFWVFLTAISWLALWWARWALPLLPLVALGAVFALDRTQRRFGHRWTRLPTTAVTIIAAVVLVAPVLPRTIDLVWSSVTGADIRLVANEWVENNIPKGSRLLIDSYTTQVSSDDYDVFMLWDDEIRPWADLSPKRYPDGYHGILAGEFPGGPDELLAAIDEAGIDYISLADVWIDMVRAEADLYPRQVSLYDTMLDSYPTVARFDHADGRTGWPITILRVSGMLPEVAE